ncbi:MAG: hypothetical protein HQL95_09915 [Magnetococcales bacterium]|nr:hypothetical protein [Magnetococcales bacterium]
MQRTLPRASASNRKPQALPEDRYFIVSPFRVNTTILCCFVSKIHDPVCFFTIPSLSLVSICFVDNPQEKMCSSPRPFRLISGICMLLYPTIVSVIAFLQAMNSYDGSTATHEFPSRIKTTTYNTIADHLFSDKIERNIKLGERYFY